ncbi:MAG TPA: hypothetical protein VNX28_01450 [Gemmataceae bacterium]|nr:hypothetical protein [Gemmataceae bacterium]
MNISELLFGILLVVALVGLASYFAYRQFQTRRAVAQDRAMPLDERGFLIRQSRRRLICSVLMFLFAGLLVGWFFIEPNVRDLKAADIREPGDTPPVVELVAYYWITALLLLFGILALAGMDFFATARYGLRQKKLLEVEHRTALEIDAARLRRERNGS